MHLSTKVFNVELPIYTLYIVIYFILFFKYPIIVMIWAWVNVSHISVLKCVPTDTVLRTPSQERDMRMEDRKREPKRKPIDHINLCTAWNLASWYVGWSLATLEFFLFFSQLSSLASSLLLEIPECSNQKQLRTLKFSHTKKSFFFIYISSFSSDASSIPIIYYTLILRNLHTATSQENIRGKLCRQCNEQWLETQGLSSSSNPFIILFEVLEQ